MRSLRWGLVLLLCLSMAAFFAACGTEDSSSFPTPQADGGGGDATDDGPDPFNNDGGLVDPDGAALTIKPTDATLTVFTGQPLPSLTYQAFYNGNPVSAVFTIDRGVQIATNSPVVAI